MAAFNVTVRIISVYIIGKKDLSFFKARGLEQLECFLCLAHRDLLVDEARIKFQLAGCKVMRGQIPLTSRIWCTVGHPGTGKFELFTVHVLPLVR